jgi:hypothetical protein
VHESAKARLQGLPTSTQEERGKREGRLVALETAVISGKGGDGQAAVAAFGKACDGVLPRK